jgi:uncharacterized membrane protein YccC
MRSSTTSRLSPVWKSGWLMHSARAALAAAASLALARLLKMPEAFWAAVSTIVVMQSSLGAAWAISIKRLAGTALGCAFGGLVASLLAPRLLVFGAGIFALGLICAALRLDQAAYRFAGMTFTIVTLVVRTEPPAIVAAHRFVEVSIGIAVALAFTGLWPELEPGSSEPGPVRTPSQSGIVDAQGRKTKGGSHDADSGR